MSTATPESERLLVRAASRGWLAVFQHASHHPFADRPAGANVVVLAALQIAGPDPTTILELQRANPLAIRSSGRNRSIRSPPRSDCICSAVRVSQNGPTRDPMTFFAPMSPGPGALPAAPLGASRRRVHEGSGGRQQRYRRTGPARARPAVRSGAPALVVERRVPREGQVKVSGS